MKLSCMMYLRNVVAFVDSELPPDRAARLDRHLQSCSSCSAVVADLRRINALQPPPEIAPSPDFDSMFRTKLAGQSRVQELSAMPRLSLAWSFLIRPAGLALSSGLAMVVFAVFLFLMRPPHAALPQQEVMAAKDLDLYANFDVIQNSEALENFELIQMLDELDQDGQG
jgi:anti-sigma factor RsiW